jgi:hypothetical protein
VLLKGEKMSALDDALLKLIEDSESGQGPYYDEVLNTEFYIPLNADPSSDQGDQAQNVSPMVLESEGKSYLMLFDSVERLNAWAEQEAPHAIYAGYRLAEVTPEALHWAVNVNTEYAKEFVPEELALLRQAVAAFRENEVIEESAVNK